MNLVKMLQYFVMVVVMTTGARSGALRGDMPDPDSGQYFSVTPEHMTVMTGDHATLPCQVANMAGQCQWTKVGFGLGTDLDLPGYPRYSLASEDTTAQGDCSLHIFPALVEDEGSWQCQVVSGDQSLVSPAMTLTVVSPPSAPYIKQARYGDMVDIVEGEELELECEVNGAKPGAEIVWTDQHGDKILTNMIETVSRNPRTKTWSTVSSVKLTPSEDMMVTCGAYNEAFPEPRQSRPFQLRLNYKPRLTLKLPEHIRDGQDVAVQCQGQAYPAVTSYRWFMDNREMLTNDNSDTITLTKVTRDMDGLVVRCEAGNKVGVGVASQTISVEFSTRIVQHPESVVARRGDKVTFSCLAEGNPAPNYVWVRGQEEKIVGVSEHLTIEASDSTEDLYKCKVFIDGQEFVSRPASLDIITAPEVSVDTVKVADVGDDVILQCKVRSLDKETKITWTRDSVPMERDNLKYRSLKMNNNLDLVIYKVDNNDFVSYGCFAENSAGHDYKVTQLKETDHQTSMFVKVVTIVPAMGVVMTAIFVLVWKREIVIKKIRRWLNYEQRPELPVVQRDVLPPIYRDRADQAVFDVLLDHGMDEKEYLRISQEYFDKIPRR